MAHNPGTTGMYINFDPNKVVLPPIFGGPAPHDESASAPLAGPSTQGTKRKRDTNTAPAIRFNNFEKVLQRATQNELNYAAKGEYEGVITKDRLKFFESRDELMNALRDAFKESHNINFAASYRAHDPGISHKQRIQTITHDIWKVTGYRFTVKDHPRMKDGHKTRLWCSQDEAHKNRPSKSSQSPRISTDGLVLAKARYPCRSGLLISSRDDGEPGNCLVVVRMHHHFAHEAYYDHTLPPEMTQSIWEQTHVKDMVPHLPPPPPPPLLSPQAEPAMTDVSDEESEEEPNGNDGAAPSQESEHLMHEPDPEPVPPPFESGAPPSLTPEVYQERMRRHITNLREFCDGLEYQLPFNDQRLLEVLESEGAQFLRFVHHCLEMEGRLKASTTADAASH
ncbi:hypothetical protein D9615_005746 [Tricholomella constricta]|uniref:Uncharacterized protein n=1 Tax=Tricholomella constricta TaxID=117010 RepID=A0A8H5HAP8_9AGAR|nr:hypothetical protein D9615_005746 [Tricholomella constricta]